MSSDDEEDSEPTRHEVEAVGRLHRVARWPGAPAARPLLALHGFTGAGADFAPLAAALGARGAGSLWAPTLLGHGEEALTDPAPYAFEAQATAVTSLRAALGLERPVLLGYSFGGRLALAALTAGAEDFAAAVLVGATPGLQEPGERAARAAEDERRAARIEALGVRAFLAEWAAHPLIATQRRIAPAHRARMARERARHTPHGLAHALREAGTGRMEPLWDRLGEVRCPVLLVTGAEDAKFTAIAAAMARRLPRAERAVVPGAGHCAHLERPEATAAAMADFLKRHGGAA